MSKSQRFKNDERVVTGNPAGAFKQPAVYRKQKRGSVGLNGNKVSNMPRVRPEGTGAGTSCEPMDAGKSH